MVKETVLIAEQGLCKYKNILGKDNNKTETNMALLLLNYCKLEKKYWRNLNNGYRGLIIDV